MHLFMCLFYGRCEEELVLLRNFWQSNQQRTTRPLTLNVSCLFPSQSRSFGRTPRTSAPSRSWSLRSTTVSSWKCLNSTTLATASRRNSLPSRLSDASLFSRRLRYEHQHVVVSGTGVVVPCPLLRSRGTCCKPVVCSGTVRWHRLAARYHEVDRLWLLSIDTTTAVYLPTPWCLRHAEWKICEKTWNFHILVMLM